MMTVRYAREHGGKTIMENVSSLVVNADSITIDGLLDGRETLSGVKILSIDFGKGLMLVGPENNS